jgi:hypothetical protein
LSRERAPLEWARTQINLGNALERIGEADPVTVRLEGAAKAYSAALTELTRERVPLEWAGAKTSLGNVLRRLGERESGTTRLEEALAVYREVVRQLHRERTPLDWAINIGNQGIVMVSIADRRNDPGMADAGIVEISTAIDAMRDDGYKFFTAFYEVQLTKAKSVVNRMR